VSRPTVIERVARLLHAFFSHQRTPLPQILLFVTASSQNIAHSRQRTGRSHGRAADPCCALSREVGAAPTKRARALCGAQGGDGAGAGLHCGFGLRDLSVQVGGGGVRAQGVQHRAGMYC